MKRLTTVLLLLGLIVTAWAQTNPYKPNPGNPLTITSFSETPIGKDSILIKFTVKGIGLWAMSEVTTGNQVVLLLHGRGYGHSRPYSIVVPAHDYAHVVFDLSTLKGVPAIGVPSN